VTFTEQLLAAGQLAPMERHPFVRAVSEGTLSRTALRRYAVELAASARDFPKRIEAVLSICGEPAVRKSLEANLRDEEGHDRMADRFARAAGASDEELAEAAARAVWHEAAVASGDWLGAFAYFAIGYEANIPPTYRALMTALVERYGIAAEELVFLSEHFEVDERHSTESAELLAAVARTDEQRAKALAGARAGGVAWWDFHRGRASIR
jgi:pyrroloquinoline quinone (PQQ) biosynthesis protein C